MMKAFGDELILEEEHSSVYNVSLTNEFQGNMILLFGCSGLYKFQFQLKL